MHYAISTKVLSQTHIWNVLKHIQSKEKHDAQMHDNETSNAWRVLQRSKKLDQGTKEQKLNHKNPTLSKQNICLEWVSHEKRDESWKNENRKYT